MLSCTKRREGQVHTSPWLRANMTAPSRHLSKNSSSASMMLSKKMLGDLPPNSKVTGVMFLEAYCMMSWPVVVSPVKATLLMRGLEAKGLPASTPNPLTMLSTPSGKMPSMSSAKMRMPTGVCSAGLRTTQLPAAKAGATFQAAIKMGKFQGMICPTTPNGSGTLRETVLASNSLTLPSSARITPAK